MTEPRDVMQFGPRPNELGDPQAFHHPSVQGSPAAMNYAQGRAAPARYDARVPTERLPMPPLEMPPQGKGPMSEQAAAYGDTARQRVAAAAVGGGIIDPEDAPMGFGRAPTNQSRIQLMPGDMLPPEAARDPMYQQGHGAQLAQNQPQVAERHGVIRGGRRLSPRELMGPQGDPMAPQPGARPLSQTADDMAALGRAMQPPPPASVSNSEEEAERRYEAARPQEDEETKKKKEAEIAKAISNLDDFDYDSLRRQINQELINNPEQRKIIEERLQPLSLSEYIRKDRVTQTVPIIPDAFAVTFISMTGVDDMQLKQLLMQESKSVEVTERYLLDKFSIMTMTAGLHAINNNPAPSHLDAQGDFDPKAFWLKFNWVLRRGIHVLASLCANHTWFEMRVRRLLVAEKVKNG